VFNLHSIVAVFRSKNETREVSGQVQATEVPHQVPENNWMLAEELVSVDHLGTQSSDIRLQKILCVADTH